jgi:hypothetical protein
MIDERNAVFLSPDWFLQDLVEMVNGTDTEISLTLCVGGFLISGLLASGHKYFDRFGELMPGYVFDKSIAETIASALSHHRNIYLKDKAENGDKPIPAFIHLKNAKFHNVFGAPLPENQDIWWRGRLSEVSGFVLGTLNEA